MKFRHTAHQRKQNRFGHSNQIGHSKQHQPGSGSGGAGRPNQARSASTQRPGTKRVRQFFDPSLFVKKAEVIDETPYQAQHSFADFGLERALLANIERKGYTQPTPIQDQAIPYLLAGRDLIGLANTGTGKTAAFLIPLINKLLQTRDQRVLIVAPTRELAVQIDDECRQFVIGLGLSTAVCIGGKSMHSQIGALRRRPQFVIGTPGRLRDLEQQGVLDFHQFANIVFDEVDHMFDMGFIRDVKYITSQLPQPRHSLYFSATLPETLKQTMASFLTDPVVVSVKTRESAANVDQDIIYLEGRPKVELLHSLLDQTEFEKVLVFSRTKRGTEKLARLLRQKGVSVNAIHGNKTQNQRQRAIDEFKRNHIQVLVATDVASRGLDIDNVSHVINYDLPETYEDYIHRIGRTGRASKKGVALTFID